MKAHWILTAMLAVVLATAGCSARRPTKASVPVSAPPAVTSIGENQSAGESVRNPPDSTASAEPGLSYERVVVPPLRPGAPVGEHEPAPQTQQPSRVAPTPSPARRPASSAGVRAPETDSTAEAETAKPADVRAPLLKPMLSETERRQLDSQINANLDRARRNFSQIRDARLGVNERAVLEEARSFAVRADQLRGSDPVLANSLAERSAILTQELLRKQ